MYTSVRSTPRASQPQQPLRSKTSQVSNPDPIFVRHRVGLLPIGVIMDDLGRPGVSDRPVIVVACLADLCALSDGHEGLIGRRIARQRDEHRCHGRHRPLHGSRAVLAATVTQAADLYALGCVLCELLTGVPPFLSESAHELGEKHLREAAPPVRLLRPDVPEDMARLIERLLAKARPIGLLMPSPSVKLCCCSPRVRSTSLAGKSSIP